MEHVDTHSLATTVVRKRTLLDISADIQKALDASEGEVTAALEALEIEEADKVDAYAVAKRELDRKKLAHKELKDHYAACEASIDRQIETLTKRLDFFMQKKGVEDMRGLVSHVFYKKTTKCVIDNPDAFCKFYEGNNVLVKTKFEPSVSAVKALLLAKTPVEGAKLVENKTVQVR
jgi:hypothetical protein